MLTSRQGIVFDIQRFSVHDGPGIRTTVFLKGCPLRCPWCHNPESQNRAPEVFRGVGADGVPWETAVGFPCSVETALATVLRDRTYYADGPGGLTISGGEPLMQGGFVVALMQGARAAGIRTCLETSGYGSAQVLERVWPLADLVYFDLKHLDPERHRRLTGVDNTLILANARLLAEAGAPVEFRLPLIPGVNDDEENLMATAAFLRALGEGRLRLVPYRPFQHDKLRWLGRPPSDLVVDGDPQGCLNRARERLSDAGIHCEVEG